MQSYWTFMLGVIDDQESTAQQKDGAIDALSELFEERLFGDTSEVPRGLCKKIIQVCEQEIVRRAQIGESPRVSICHLMFHVLCHSDHIRAKTISRVINHNTMMQFVFDGLESENDSHEAFGYLFTYMLRHSSASDRIALIIRYFYKLRCAIISILSSEMMNACDTECFFISTEMAGVVATMPTELYKWAIDMQNIEDWLFNVLESAIDAPKTMERLLGYGLLSVSREYAHLPIDQSTVRHAHVFRAILLMNPEFRQMFRRWTCDGVVGNATADYGRTIPPRLATAGITYVFVDEDTEM